MTRSINNDDNEKGWLSAFLLVFGAGAVVLAGLALVRGSLLPGLLGVGVAILFFSLRRIIDHQQAAARRLRQIEVELERMRGGGK